jgi:hypothetical protein
MRSLTQPTVALPAQALRRLSPSGNASFWLQAFLWLQIACQVALLFESLGSLRVLVRTSAFAASLLLLFFLPGTERPHPARRWGLAALLLVGLGLAHPTTNSVQGGVAHLALYAAILAPLFWVSRLSVTPTAFRHLLLCLWGFHTLSAGVGVLQMHYPGRFQPNVSSVIRGLGNMAEAYKLELANGERVWRPMGLTDVPGGAAGAGLYAVVFGLGFLLNSRSWLVCGLSVGGMALGLFCLYISEVRSLLVMAGICSCTLIGILLWRQEMQRLLGTVLVMVLLAVSTFLWATAIGGSATIHRLSSLVEDRPAEVYARNRGHFLVHTFTELLPEYPLGAGLARWGMMRAYFGDEANLDSPQIWVEIQWTGWVLDGGALLLLAYSAAVAAACWVALRVARSRLPEGMPLWGALVFALNIGTVAVTFNYAIFMSQGGMEFWLLNAALFAAAAQAARGAKPRRPPTARTRRQAPLWVQRGAPAGPADRSRAVPVARETE